ncbi:MAG: Lar family restriction alleviation protein [Adlercreutzia sp.]|nr:Lar family restriction alleviation protein [Adlercreutzia sp.]MEE0583765.1 Lar family restriction alleviation protein [Adlercreutzia sp.]
MSDELKVCPFCGGDARIHSKVLAEGFDSGYWAVCDECGKGDTLPHESEEEAAAAWNARAAVADEQFSLAVNDGEAWQKVRTCGQPRGFIPCDSDSFGSMSFAELWCEHCDIELDPEWQFCPSCGAKIEGESR